MEQTMSERADLREVESNQQAIDSATSRQPWVY